MDITLPTEHVNTKSWNVLATIEKWHDTADYDAGLAPDEVVTDRDNLLLNAGITRMLNLLIASGATQAFDPTHCRIAVGDSNTAASASQTDVQAVTNKYYKLCSSDTVSAQTLTVVATFGTAVANFAWQEWGIDQGTADSATTGVAPMLNRKVTSLGTKASGATWVFTVAITIA